MEQCCTHRECERSVSIERCRRFMTAVFVGSEPLGDRCLFVKENLQTVYPGKDVEKCVVVGRSVRTNWGFHVSVVVFTLPGLVKFSEDDVDGLRTLFTTEGGVEPLFFPLSCCDNKVPVVFVCETMLFVKQYFPPSSGGVVTSAEDVRHELEYSVFRAIGTTCC